MCNHSYVGNYKHKPRSMGQRCPYPELYEKIRMTAPGAPETEISPTLPLDDRGACIFHSQNIAWKRANNFERRFLQLLQLLDADGTVTRYDFAEFVFVGIEIQTKGGTQHHLLRIADMSFKLQADFTGSSFLDSFELDRVDFQKGANFSETTFYRDLKVTQTRFVGFEFDKAKAEHLAFFIKVEFLSFALFNGAHFMGRTEGHAVKFEDARFEGIADFSGATFAVESSAGFLKTRFEDFTDFGRAEFSCHTVFTEVHFASVTEFIDTLFNPGSAAARYRGAAVEFNNIEVPAGAVLTFMSTDLQKKMFNHDVQISLKQDPAGTIRFKNVNFSMFSPQSKERLTQLAKFGRVEIGSGCIKYRFQTDIRTISISQGNAPLVLEICQTFANYFTASNGINLGLEIVERDTTKVSFFYFTDEDISESAFRERLARTEQSLWNLLSASYEEQILALEAPPDTALTPRKESALINAVDGVSALLGTFFRVGARLALGTWKEADTKALLTAIRFNDNDDDHRALSLHRTLVAKYTGKDLFLINKEQNGLLPPMVRATPNLLPSGKIRILFLGANSSDSPLELEKEVKKIQTSLKLAKERDNLELKQEWAVTVDSLIQAMLDESPTIVHFSGHGGELGIALQDDTGDSQIVPTDALSDLFKLFKDTVRCVVLNSCYSESQAQAIRQHIPHVVGMRFAISDLAGTAFSTGFYKAIGAGRDIPFAFDMGKASMRMEGFSGEKVVALL